MEQRELEPKEEEDRPWERPGAVRRDCAAHRGPFLHLLAMTALVFSVPAAACVAPGLLSLPLSLIVIALGRDDLRRMRAGRMDPQGRPLTRQAIFLATGAALLPIGFWVSFMLIVVLVQLSKGGAN
jgi:hypothetical protein